MTMRLAGLLTNYRQKVLAELAHEAERDARLKAMDIEDLVAGWLRSRS